MEAKRFSSRLSAKDEWSSQIAVQPLDDGKVRGSLRTLKDLVQSALGPNGRLKFFQSSSGGHVTVTSTSSKILHGLSGLSHPIPRLILSAVRGHLDAYSDGGLRTALLLLSLIQSSFDLPVPRSLVTQINQHSLEVITNHLQSCRWKMNVDIGHMKSMLSIVNSIIGTKPACHLSESDKQHISVLVIKAFLQSLPSNTTKDCSAPVAAPLPVQIVTCEGDPVTESKILQGVLLQAPEIATFQRNKALVNHSTKVALYNVSMAGDTDEWFSDRVKMEMAGGHDVNMESAVLRQMLKVADWLLAAGVQVVACQKCVHPALKQYLRDKSAFVIDRLSIVHISVVQCLTGAKILSTFSMDVPESSFGEVQKIEHVVINDKSFIHLLPQSSFTSSAVCTLLLCSPDETSLDELKTVCQSSVSALHETLASPYVVPGAGCLDTHLASFLRQYGQNIGPEIIAELGCTKGQFVAGINNVAYCLESLARSLEHDSGSHVTDSANQHHWSLSPEALDLKPSMLHCMCGLVLCNQSLEWSMMGHAENSSCDNRDSCCTEGAKKIFDNAVLDMYPMKMNSYRTAFETANAILRIHCVVCSNVTEK
ncbi:hypothetical protein ACROYT_G003717 [Oculina patagonica]